MTTSLSALHTTADTAGSPTREYQRYIPSHCGGIFFAGRVGVVANVAGEVWSGLVRGQVHVFGQR